MRYVGEVAHAAPNLSAWGSFDNGSSWKDLAKPLSSYDVPHTGSDNYIGRTVVVTRADDALAKPAS